MKPQLKELPLYSTFRFEEKKLGEKFMLIGVIHLRNGYVKYVCLSMFNGFLYCEDLMGESEEFVTRSSDKYQFIQLLLEKCKWDGDIEQHLAFQFGVGKDDRDPSEIIKYF